MTREYRKKYYKQYYKANKDKINNGDLGTIN